MACRPLLPSERRGAWQWSKGGVVEGTRALMARGCMCARYAGGGAWLRCWVFVVALWGHWQGQPEPRRPFGKLTAALFPGDGG